MARTVQRGRARAGALSAMLAGALPAAAQDATRATVPVYAAVVVMTIPDGFDAAHEAEEGGSYILEFVPLGQTVLDWDQMLTLTAVEAGGEAAGLPARDLVDWGLDRIAEGYQAGCARSIIAETFSDAPPAGAEDGVLVYIGCPEITATGLSEQMMFWIAAGQGNLYTLQWAERGPPADSMAFDPPHWFDRFALLNTMSLCVPQPAEQAPYPSCLD